MQALLSEKYKKSFLTSSEKHSDPTLKIVSQDSCNFCGINNTNIVESIISIAANILLNNYSKNRCDEISIATTSKKRKLNILL